MNRIIAVALLALLLLLLTRCGIEECLKDGKCPDSDKPDPVATVVPGIPTKAPTVIPTPIVEPANPFCSGVQDSRKHLLHKPKSDNRPEGVLVFDGKYKREFRAVKIELKNGQFSDGYWKPLELRGNPDADGPRQHWRLKVLCSDIKAKALIIVDDTIQECRFQIPGDACKRWE